MAKRLRSPKSALTQIEQIKKLAIIAMFSDNELMDHLVLKGGNALDLVHRISTRASIDIDFSMEGDFPEGIQSLRFRAERSLQSTFREAGFEVFDVSLEEKPPLVTQDLADFWGGYGIEFKLIQAETFKELEADIAKLRRNALMLGRGSKFLIDISRFEHTTGKETQDLDGYRIFVYSAAMIACEKMRAICQQTNEYAEVVKRSRAAAPRARDFVDIHTIVTEKSINLASVDTMQILKAMFAAKHVPLELLREIDKYRDFHRSDFRSVLDTVKPGIVLQNFDFYFDFVLNQVKQLKTLWDV